MIDADRLARAIDAYIDGVPDAIDESDRFPWYIDIDRSRGDEASRELALDLVRLYELDYLGGSSEATHPASSA